MSDFNFLTPSGFTCFDNKPVTCIDTIKQSTSSRMTFTGKHEGLPAVLATNEVATGEAQRVPIVSDFEDDRDNLLSAPLRVAVEAAAMVLINTAN